MVRDEIENIAEHKLNGGDDRFTTLCDNVENTLITTKDSFQQMYLLHDKLSDKKLPAVILRELTTISCNLQKGMSSLSIEVERLIEKTRMYAQPFENQCNALKELRRQQDIKQRKLEIALKKLEIMSGRNAQLERQRVVGKWERLFLKCSNFKKGTLGWRHTVEEYKTKLKNNESVAYLFRDLQLDKCESPRNDSGDEIVSDAPLYDDDDFRFSSDEEAELELDRFSTATSMEEELMFGSHFAEDSVFDWVSKNSTELRKSCDILTEDLPNSNEPKSKLSDYNDDAPGYPNSNEDMLGDDTLTHSEHLEIPNVSAVTNTAVLQSIMETPETVDAYASTTDLDSFFQVRIVRPDWLQSDALFYALTFGSQVRKGIYQGNNPVNMDASLEYSEDQTEEPCFCFNLECSSDDIFESEGLKNTSLRIALHEDPSAGILGFTSTTTNDIRIYSEREVKESTDRHVFHNKLDLHFPSNNNDTKDLKNSNYQLSIICSVYQKPRERYREKSTETLPYDELEDLIVENYMNAFRERCQSACVETEEKPIYTEETFNAINDELTAFKEGRDNSIGCRIQVDASTSPLCDYTNEMEVHLEDAIRYPRHEGVEYYPPRQSSCPVGRRVTFDDDVMSADKVLKRESTVPKMNHRSKRLCEKLPSDFFSRLRKFQEEKGKKRVQLTKEITEMKNKEICKRLEAEKKLSASEVDDGPSLHDYCLPSVFMPAKNNVVYKVKARSYLHPSNQVVRTAQLKPFFQLPDVQTITSHRNLRALRLELTEGN